MVGRTGERVTRSVSNLFASRGLAACLTECYNLFTLTLPTFNVVAWLDYLLPSLSLRFPHSNRGQKWERVRYMKMSLGVRGMDERGDRRVQFCSRQHSRIVASTLGLLETNVNSCGRSLALSALAMLMRLTLNMAAVNVIPNRRNYH